MTRESTQKSLIFNTKTKGENYNEENKKLKNVMILYFSNVVVKLRSSPLDNCIFL